MDDLLAQFNGLHVEDKKQIIDWIEKDILSIGNAVIGAINTHTIDTQNIHFPENIETDIDYENLHIAVDIIQKEGVAYVCEYLTTKNYRIDDAIIGIINTYLQYYISVVLEGF